MKKVLIKVVYLILSLIAVAVCNLINKTAGQIALNILGFLITLYLTLIMVYCINWFFYWIENKELNRLRKERSLFSWISLEFDEKFLFDLLKDIKSFDVMQNLREIRKKLKMKIGSELRDYYLFKGYLEWHEKNSILSNMQTLLVTIVTSFLTAVLTQGLIIEKTYELFDGVAISVSKLSSVLDIATIAIALLVIILVGYAEITKNKRRIALTKMVIEEIIREKETAK